MDALDLLITDHNRVRGLFRQFDEAKEHGDRGAMEAIADKLTAELGVHMAVEEEILYPAIVDLTDEVRAKVAEGIEEHHQVKVLLAEVADLSSDDPTWVAKWTVIGENIEHHAGEEEDDIFPKVRSHTDSELRSAVGETLDQRKGELGAPTLADRDGLTVERVRELATDQLIPGRSTMSTDELRATVSPLA